MTTTLYETVTVKTDFTSVPLIVWRRFRRPMPGLVEAIYEANPGLADNGPYLPVGTEFQMPVETPRETDTVLETVTLW